MAEYRVEYIATERVEYYTYIDADSEEDARERFENGEYDDGTWMHTDTQETEIVRAYPVD